MLVLRSEWEEWAEEGIKLSEGHWFKVLGLKSNKDFPNTKWVEVITDNQQVLIPGLYSEYNLTLIRGLWLNGPCLTTPSPHLLLLWLASITSSNIHSICFLDIWFFFSLFLYKYHAWIRMLHVIKLFYQTGKSWKTWAMILSCQLK